MLFNPQDQFHCVIAMKDKNILRIFFKILLWLLSLFLRWTGNNTMIASWTSQLVENIPTSLPILYSDYSLFAIALLYPTLHDLNFKFWSQLMSRLARFVSYTSLTYKRSSSVLEPKNRLMICKQGWYKITLKIMCRLEWFLHIIRHLASIPH